MKRWELASMPISRATSSERVPGSAYAIDGGHRVGSREARDEAQLIEVGGLGTFAAFEHIDDFQEIDAVGVQKTRDHLGDLSALPGGPDGVGDERERSAHDGVKAAGDDYGF